MQLHLFLQYLKRNVTMTMIMMMTIAMLALVKKTKLNQKSQKELEQLLVLNS